MYFNIVQPLVCKTVTRLHLASFGQALLIKMLITLEPCGMFGSNFVYKSILHFPAAGMQNGAEASQSIILAG